MTIGKSPGVDEFMARLDHARKDDIEAIRAIIADADVRLSEQIKWNAPSFGVNGEDRITFRLHPGDRVQLIFHRGAKPKSADDFSFDDSAGLLEWAAKDRAVLTFESTEQIQERRAALEDLVRRWIDATT